MENFLCQFRLQRRIPLRPRILIRLKPQWKSPIRLQCQNLLIADSAWSDVMPDLLYLGDTSVAKAPGFLISGVEEMDWRKLLVIGLPRQIANRLLTVMTLYMIYSGPLRVILFFLNRVVTGSSRFWTCWTVYWTCIMSIRASSWALGIGYKRR